MFKNPALYLSCVALTTFNSFADKTHEQFKTEALEANQYTNNEIGWNMPIPKGFSITPNEVVDKLTDRGQKAISESYGEELSTEKLVNLLHFYKGTLAIFQSTLEPFEEEYEDEWSLNNIGVKQMLLDAYEQQGIEAQSTETKHETIDGVVFEFYEITVLAPNGRVLIKQLLYSSFIKGYDFGVSISYMSDEHRDIVIEHFRKSTFTK